MKDDRGWIPARRRLDWIESIAAAALGPPSRRSRRPPSRDVPIVDRDAGRVLSVLAGGRRRIVEVGTAYGYSTLWLALGQPAGGTIVTIDPDRERTDLARGWWREAGHRRRADHGRHGPGARGVRGRRSGARRPVRPRVHRRAQAGVRRLPRGADDGRLAPGALVLADNVLWSGRVSGARPVDAGRREHRPRCARSASASSATRGSPPRSCRSATACSSRPGAAEAARLRARPGPPVRDPARAGRHARGRARPRGWSDGRRCLDGARRRVHPVLAPGRASVRFARNGAYADATTRPRRRRRGGDDPARLGGVGAAESARILELRDRPVRRRDPRPSSPIGWRRPRTAPRSGSSAGRGSRRARRRPGQEAEAARHAGRAVESLEYEAHESMAAGGPRRHRRRDRGAVRRRARLAIVHRTGRRAPRRGLDRGRGRQPASRRRVRGRPLRHRRDQGPRADLEGRAVRATATSGSASRARTGPEEGA